MTIAKISLHCIFKGNVQYLQKMNFGFWCFFRFSVILKKNQVHVFSNLRFLESLEIQWSTPISEICPCLIIVNYLGKYNVRSWSAWFLGITKKKKKCAFPLIPKYKNNKISVLHKLWNESSLHDLSIHSHVYKHFPRATHN